MSVVDAPKRNWTRQSSQLCPAPPATTVTRRLGSGRFRRGLRPGGRPLGTDLEQQRDRVGEVELALAGPLRQPVDPVRVLLAYPLRQLAILATHHQHAVGTERRLLGVALGVDSKVEAPFARHRIPEVTPTGLQPPVELAPVLGPGLHQSWIIALKLQWSDEMQRGVCVGTGPGDGPDNGRRGGFKKGDVQGHQSISRMSDSM